MTIVQIIDVVAMPDGGMAAVRTVLMVMMGVMGFVACAHTAISLFEMGGQLAGRKHDLANSRRDSRPAAGTTVVLRKVHVRRFYRVGYMLRKAYPYPFMPACGWSDGSRSREGWLNWVALGCIPPARSE